MVEHIVLFKLSPHATPEQRLAMITGLRNLKQQVPGVTELSVGQNFSDRNQGYDIGLVVRFRDRAALAAYLPHPAHRGCVEDLINPIKTDVIVVDYDIT